MPYQVGVGDPSWSFDTVEFEKQVATFTKNASVTTQTGWLAFISTLDATQTTQAVRAILRAMKCSVP